MDKPPQNLEQSNNDPLSLLNRLIEQGAPPEEFTRQLFEFNYQQVKKEDPNLAEMMQACAIPRDFDATIIGVLRDQPDDEQANARLLTSLQNFEFVLSGQDENYIYHDNTRDMLLEQWQQPENKPQYEQYKSRLVGFYSTQGQRSYKENAYETALTHLNHGISLQTDDGLLYNWRGHTHLAMGNYPTAQSDLEQALTLNIHQPDTYFQLAIAYYYLREYPACIANLTKVIELEPINAAAYNNRGISYDNLKEYERAIADYEQAIQLNPEYAAAYYNTACAYALQKDMNAALISLQRALELEPIRYLKLSSTDSDFDAIRDEARFQSLLAIFSKSVHDASLIHRS